MRTILTLLLMAGTAVAAPEIARVCGRRMLYWQAIEGKTLYKLSTTNIDRPKPEVVGDNGVADGLWMGRDGRST